MMELNPLLFTGLTRQPRAASVTQPCRKDTKILDQAGQVAGIMAGPSFLRHSLGEFPKVCAADLLSPPEDGFKTVPIRHVLID
jgi:hypothetical protein